MNLFEVTDEFATPKTEPTQDLAYLEKKSTAINYHLKLIRELKKQLKDSFIGSTMHPGWNQSFPENDEQRAEIQKILDLGYIAVTKTRPDRRKEIIMYVPSVDKNKEIVPRFQRAVDREAKLEQMQREMPVNVKRAKTRLSAWKRKQPTYVPRATGKELLDDLKGKVQKFIDETGFAIPITNSYYWAKNKMIVIELSVRISAPGMTVNGFAKTFKVKVDKFMVDQGYIGFRVTDRYIDGNLTIVKIQLDDVEAKNKASENAPE